MTKTMRTISPFQQVISKTSPAQVPAHYHYFRHAGALATVGLALEEWIVYRLRIRGTPHRRLCGNGGAVLPAGEYVHADGIGKRQARQRLSSSGSSFRGDTSCRLGFFAWALLRASLRISTSIVLRPSFEDMFIGHAPACGRIQALSYVAKRWGLVPVGRSTSGSYAFQVSD
jgi:hypothetical protein